MTRLIDADRLKRSFEANAPIAFQDCVPGIHAIIDLEPTVDAVPLIRCKDCKYFERLSIYCHGLCDVHCNGIGEREMTSEVDFCSWAERKEE